MRQQQDGPLTGRNPRSVKEVRSRRRVVAFAILMIATALWIVAIIVGSGRLAGIGGVLLVPVAVLTASTIPWEGL